MQELRISVRALIEFVYKSGDIDNRYVSRDRLLEGGRIHRMIQKQMDESYTGEVSLACMLEHKGFTFLLEGRADGVFSAEGQTFVDEIKTTSLTAEELKRDENPAHWAQGCCYAYMLAVRDGLERVALRLTYYLMENGEIVHFERSYSYAELESFVVQTLEKYLLWADFSRAWEQIRNDSIRKMDFPFPQYRKGQRELAVAVYRTVKEKKKLFCQAPTGIGKTISTLFPAVKAMGEGLNSKIFYLTAKTVTRQVAEAAVEKMGAQGLRLKSVTLTAKDKICFCGERKCNPEHCPYAKGHFDRVNDAMYDLITNHDRLDRGVIEEYARKHRVCPFEFSLDLATLADCIICDYNYVFDPRVYLQRFFDEGGDYTFLVDEAHNLVDRAREMFSARVSKSTFFEVKKTLEKEEKKLVKLFSQVNRFFLDLKKNLGERRFELSGQPDELYLLLSRFTEQVDLYLKRHAKDPNEQLLDLYFEVVSFLRIWDLYDERYVTLCEKEGNDVGVKMYCIDPSHLLSLAFKRGSAAVLFSATLMPMEYFKDILGGNEEDYGINLPSPFRREHLNLLAADYISTKYRDRERSCGDIADLLYRLAAHQTGNYIAYFPSYRYLQQVFDLFAEAYPEMDTLVQTPDMGEEDREAFLARFRPGPERSLLGFAVLGGIFGEGIDLQGDRLSGCAIVSVGLPQINVEQDIIRDYFDTQNGQGFEYAYMYPGMNKVLQAAGRVIRSETDTGTVVLIDSRFTSPRYTKLFPRHWQHYRRVGSVTAFLRRL